MKKEVLYYDDSAEDVIEKVNNLLKNVNLKINVEFGGEFDDRIFIALQKITPKEGK